MYTYRIKSNKRTIYFCIMNPAYFSRHRACNPPAYSSRNIIQRTLYVPAYFSRESFSLHLDFHFSIYNRTVLLCRCRDGQLATTARRQSLGFILQSKANLMARDVQPTANLWQNSRETAGHDMAISKTHSVRKGHPNMSTQVNATTVMQKLKMAAWPQLARLGHYTYTLKVSTFEVIIKS